MVSFGKALDLEVVAEGVETEQQRALLIDAKVDLAQGYLFSPPMSADQLAAAYSTREHGATDGQEMTAPQVAPPSSEASAERAQVMLIDDDPRMLHATARLLRSWGYPCNTYTDAGSALEAIERSPPEMVVIDMYMPNIDGFEFIKRFRGLAPDTRILAVSGDFVRGYPTKVLEMSRALGADAVLQKPVGPERLRPVIERLIGEPRQRLSGGRSAGAAASTGRAQWMPLHPMARDEDAGGA
jgi:CheY-like chemotaxis protein